MKNNNWVVILLSFLVGVLLSIVIYYTLINKKTYRSIDISKEMELIEMYKDSLNKTQRKIEDNAKTIDSLEQFAKRLKEQFDKNIKEIRSQSLSQDIQYIKDYFKNESK